MWRSIIMLTIARSLSPATWIGDSLEVIGNLTLKQLTLPGTHDSGAYCLSDIPMPGDRSSFWSDVTKVAEKKGVPVSVIAKDWSLTQDQNLYNQMMGGIRYFDLRSEWSRANNTWVTFHYLQGLPVKDLLSDVSRFMREHTKEIVVVEMSHFDGEPTPEDLAALKEMVMSEFEEFLCPVDLDFGFTVGEMVSSGKRAIVTMEDVFDNQVIWPPSTIYNTYADTPNLAKMVTFNFQTVQDFVDNEWPKQIFKMSWTLTADGETIAESLLPRKPQTLIQLADIGNLALPSFYDSISNNGWRMGNILIIDHYEESAILEVVLKMNGIVKN